MSLPQPRRHGNCKKTPQAKWRQRQWESGKCGYCGTSTSAGKTEGKEDFRLGCERCRHRRNIEMQYQRHFLRDFK